VGPTRISGRGIVLAQWIMLAWRKVDEPALYTCFLVVSDPESGLALDHEQNRKE
jgi:hypothetical protein